MFTLTSGCVQMFMEGQVEVGGASWESLLLMRVSGESHHSWREGRKQRRKKGSEQDGTLLKETSRTGHHQLFKHPSPVISLAAQSCLKVIFFSCKYLENNRFWFLFPFSIDAVCLCYSGQHVGQVTSYFEPFTLISRGQT